MLKILQKAKCLLHIGQIKKNGDNMKDKEGLYANIHKKRERVKAGSKERMRKPGSKGAPSKSDFEKAKETVKKDRKLV